MCVCVCVYVCICVCMCLCVYIYVFIYLGIYNNNNYYYNNKIYLTVKIVTVIGRKTDTWLYPWECCFFLLETSETETGQQSHTIPSLCHPPRYRLYAKVSQLPMV